jgi:hypothetical protein
MKYQTKVKFVDAIQFKYDNTDSIESIKELLGDKMEFFKYGCERHIGAIAWGSILGDGISINFNEGDYIVKADGGFSVMGKSKFEEKYQSISISNELLW